MTENLMGDPAAVEATADAVVENLPENPTAEDVRSAVKAVMSDGVVQITVNLRRDAFAGLQELAEFHHTDVTGALHLAIANAYSAMQARRAARNVKRAGS
jgi:hypothetical protein